MAGKDKKGVESVDDTIQVNVRVPVPFVNRLERTAKRLGIDRSSLLRLMIAEKLPEYEDRATEAHKGEE